MKDIHPAVQNELYQRKLKHLRDYHQNCKELENDFKWFVKYCIPGTVLLVMLLLSGIYLVVRYADAIDSFFNLLMPNA
jgi:hypothetical protein